MIKLISSVQTLRNKTWVILASVLTLLMATALVISYLLVRQSTQNTIYHTLYTTLTSNDLYESVILSRSSDSVNVYSDTYLSSASAHELLYLATDANYQLITDGTDWFYFTVMGTEQSILFVNITATITNQNDMLIRLLIFGVVGLVLILITSLLLANNLIKPTKMTVEMQKELLLLKKRFTANTSHELRTPLTMIKGGYDEVLRNKSQTIEEQLQWFRMIGDGINRIDVLANELTILADLENEKFAPTLEESDISHCITEFVQPLTAVAKARGITFKTAIAPGIIAHTNLLRLEQLLKIFFNNAFQYVNEQGEIDIEVTKTNQHAKISITNTGAGIPAAELETIFEHFHRLSFTNVTASGSGLGLTIARKIVDQLGAKVSVKSVVNEFTQFELIL